MNEAKPIEAPSDTCGHEPAVRTLYEGGVLHYLCQSCADASYAASLERLRKARLAAEQERREDDWMWGAL